jgi:hypothetical protein
MTDREYWKMFEQTGNIQDYLNYRRSLSSGAGGSYEDEDYYGRIGDMGEEDRRSRSGDYPFDA